jgi:hypothetical protein
MRAGRTGKVPRMRICARSGCNSPAVATLSYDRIALIAYLVTAEDPTAREPGDLCERHVAKLVLPRQWQLDDRRAGAQPAPAEPPAKKLRVVRSDEPAKPAARKATAERPKAKPKRARTPKSKWVEVGPSLFDAPGTDTTAAPEATRDDTGEEPAWMPRFGPESDADEVLAAKTPLLRRAFGGS